MKTAKSESGAPGGKSGLGPLERDVVEIFVRLAGLLRLPRTVGEIYGLLFLSPAALPMEAIRGSLRLSKGGISMGLKTLRSFGAVRVVYIPGDRREHYLAETELRKLVSGFVRDQLEPHLRNGEERLERMRALLGDLPTEDQLFLQERIERLGHWQKRADQIIPLALKIIRA